MLRRRLERGFAVGLILGLVWIGLSVQQCARLKHRAMAASARAEKASLMAAEHAGSAAVVVTNGGAATTPRYGDFLARIRGNYRNVLDLEPDHWSPTKKPWTFHAPERFTFSADNIPAPDAAQLDKYRRDAGVVRPMPYPYFQAITAASDCCATEYRDVYYTHALLSRRYGLDLPRVLLALQLLAGDRTSTPRLQPLCRPFRRAADCAGADRGRLRQRPADGAGLLLPRLDRSRA